MGFLSDTPVLTKSGFMPISQIEPGDVLPTPLGDTVVNFAIRYPMEFDAAVDLGGGVVVARLQRMLMANREWGFVRDAEDMRLRSKIGALVRQEVLDSDVPNAESLFTFSSKALFAMAGQTSVEGWDLITENALAVVGHFVTKAGTVLADGVTVMDKRIVAPENVFCWVSNTRPNPVITQTQLDNFKNEHF